MIAGFLADAGAGAGFEGFDLVALALSAVAPLVVAGVWVTRRLRRVRARRLSRP